MNIKELLPAHIRDHYILSFDHGSYVYGINSENSDRDTIGNISEETLKQYIENQG